MSSPNPIAGSWTYRSFRNIPGEVKELKEILFADAVFTFNDAPFGSVEGVLDMEESGKLVCKGSIGYGTPFTVRFQGVGHEGESKGWVYDYVGYVVQDWPSGVDQVQAIVGSVTRTVGHGEKSPAGYVASFVCVRR